MLRRLRTALRYAHVVALLLLPGLCGKFSLLQAEERAIGYLQVPAVDKEVLERRGKEEAVLVAGEQGEVWPEYERSVRRPRKLPLYAQPDADAELLAEVDVNALMVNLVTMSDPGRKEFSSPAALRDYDSGKSKLLVFEKRDDWLRVRFRAQPPFNARFAWVRLSEETGGFISKSSE